MYILNFLIDDMWILKTNRLVVMLPQLATFYNDTLFHVLSHATRVRQLGKKTKDLPG
jgi:hypothetical protein